MKKIFYSLASFVLISSPLFVSAQDTVQGSGEGNTGGSNPSAQPINISIGNPFKGGNDIPSIVNAVMQNIVMPLAAVAVVLAIIYSGFKYIIAQGNPADIKAANQGLMYALIGAVILLGATGISLAIQHTICGPLVQCGL